MKLPTDLGKRLLLNYFRVRMEHPSEAHIAVGDFQRMALVGTIEDALATTVSWFKPEHRVIGKKGEEWTAIELCYSTVKQDVLGLAVDALLSVSCDSGSSKDRIAASAILNELYGDKELVSNSVLTDKLVVDLVGKG